MMKFLAIFWVPSVLAFQPQMAIEVGIKDPVKLGPLSVSSLGVGTWAWGDKLFWQYDENEDKELENTFKGCVDEGINLFDTAEVYGFGRSEELCGSFRKAAEIPGAIIATKFAPLPWRFGKEAVVKACRESLKRVGAESIELYQLHWPSFPFFEEQHWDGLAECVEEGLVKAVGVSNYGPTSVRRVHKALAARGIPLASNQVHYSLLQRSIESSGAKRVCEELDVRILAYSPLAQGILTGKYSMDRLPSGPRSSIVRNILPRAESLLQTMTEIADARQKTMAQIALNWCITKGAIPIPGARNIKQAKDNAEAMGWRLSEEEIRELDISARAVGREMPMFPSNP